MSSRSKPSSEPLPFFAYGTLLPGQPNSYLWQNEVAASYPAWFVGAQLFDMGNYPMLVEAQDGVVQGRLIYLKPAHYLKIVGKIDALEGYDEATPNASAYRRRAREISLEAITQVLAWVYVGQARYVGDAPLIVQGNWQGYIEGKMKMKQIEKWWDQIDTVSGMHEPR